MLLNDLRNCANVALDRIDVVGFVTTVGAESNQKNVNDVFESVFGFLDRAKGPSRTGRTETGCAQFHPR